MAEGLTEAQLAEIEARAKQATYHATFHGDFARGSTWWQDAERDLRTLLAEVRRLREMLDAWVRDVGCDCGHAMDRIEHEDGRYYFICDWCGASRFR